MWCIPPRANAEFVCRMEDILDVYRRPYDRKKPVVCMDETNKQYLKEIREPIGVKPGRVAKYDVEYERNGTGNIFLAFEPLNGRQRTKVTAQRKREDWAYFIKELVEEGYPEAEKIVLVMDNLNTHAGSSLYETFAPSQAKQILDKLEIHYTPKHGSWLNIAEIELSHLNRQCLDRRIADQDILDQEVGSWSQQRNHQRSTVDWQFTTQDARIKLKKLYPTFAYNKP